MAMQALLLGFGGSGAHVLTYLKELAVYKYGEKPATLRFLLFDTIADWRPGKTVKTMGGRSEETIAMARTPEKSASLDPDTEYFHLGDAQPSLYRYVNELLTAEDAPRKYPHIYPWLNAAWLKKNIAADKLTIAEGAAQQRQIGRFALFQNVERLRPALADNLAELERHAEGSTLNVWIVGSAAGGTGGGCLLDAAYLVRMAAPQPDKLRVSAVIVLPDVYHGVEGVAKSRAYSLFRELERLQMHDFEQEDEYRVGAGGSLLTSDQLYDAHARHRAMVTAKLFDNIFLVGRICRIEEERSRFFSSVVAAMDPYVDQNSGPRQLEQSVNVVFDTVSFGGGRIYIPMTTYQELFAWEEVEKWLVRVAAPRTDGGGGVHAGSPQDRKDDADRMVASLLPMFEDLLGKVDKSRDEQMAYARSLDPKSLVTRNFQLASAAVAGMSATAAQRVDVVPLTYVNPFISISETNEADVPAADRRVKTYSENRKARGPAETKEASAERFAAELEEVYRSYTDRTGPAESFEQGRRTVYEIIREALVRQVDQQMVQSLAGQPIAADLREPSSGTAFNRLHQSLEWIIAGQEGTLDRIKAVLSIYAQSLDERKNTVQRLTVDAVVALRDYRPTLLDKMQIWVEDPQLYARSQWADLACWYQQRELLAMVMQLLDELRARYTAWYGLMHAVLRQLVLPGVDRQPSLSIVRSQHINRLRQRLLELSKDRTALISLAHRGEQDMEMQGFADRLRQDAIFDRGVSLAERALGRAAWELSVAQNGDPQLILHVPVEGQRLSQAVGRLGDLHEQLQKEFRRRIDGVIGERTIFDYLDYVEREKNYSRNDIIACLDEATPLLIDANRRPSGRLFYRRPRNVDHQRLADNLNTELQKRADIEAKDAEDTHSDPYSLTLLKLVFPNPAEIQDLRRCQDEYMEMQVQPLSGSFERDQPLRRAETFHIFRAEQEAWYIERQMWRTAQRTGNEDERLSPRLVRLLAHPERVKAFVDCVATGVLAHDGDRWLFHDRVKDGTLQASRKSSLMRAATVFILQRTEDREGILAEIDVARASESATIAAREKGKSKRDCVQEFINSGALEDLLQEHIPDGEHPARAARTRTGLAHIFRFYGDPNVKMDLSERLL